MHGWLYFSCLKISNIIINLKNTSISSNVLLTILSIVRSIVMGLKNYCWDKSGFASCKLNQFLQTRFCQSFSHRRIIDKYFYLFQIVELSWIYWTHWCFRTVHTPRPRKFYRSIPSEHMLYFKEWLMCNEIWLKPFKQSFKKMCILTVYYKHTMSMIFICLGDAHFQKRYFEALILFHYTL